MADQLLPHGLDVACRNPRPQFSRRDDRALEHHGTGRHDRTRSDIRTVQSLPGHTDVRTTMIYGHVPDRGPLALQSPIDRL